MSLINPPALKKGYSFRACLLEDVEAVVHLMNLCALKVIGEADERTEDVLADWQTPGYDQVANQRVVIAPDGELVGWAGIFDSRPAQPILDIYVHPNYEVEGIGEHLFGWCEARAREVMTKAPPEARVVLWAHTYEADKWYRALLENCGMQVIRHYWRMEREMDSPPAQPHCPEGVSVRTLHLDEDLRKVLRVERAAFQDHFGYVDSPFNEHFERWSGLWLSEGRFDPSLWFLAVRGDEVVGIALCQIGHGMDDDIGWVKTLGVLREARRKGIALVLLRTAFHAFYQRGLRCTGLSVDASSLTGATELYRQVGMSVALQYDLLEKELRAGIDLATH
jgi:mycothiol synthase